MDSPPDWWTWFPSKKPKKTSESWLIHKVDSFLKNWKLKRQNSNYVKSNQDPSDQTKFLMWLPMMGALSATLTLLSRWEIQLNWTCRKIRSPKFILLIWGPLFTFRVVTTSDVLDNWPILTDTLDLLISSTLKTPKVFPSQLVFKTLSLLEIPNNKPLFLYQKTMVYI